MKTMFSEVTKICEKLYTASLGTLKVCEGDLCVINVVIESDITLRTALPILRNGEQYYLLLTDEIVKMFNLEKGAFIELDEEKGELRLIGKKYDEKSYIREHYIPCPQTSPTQIRSLHKVSINKNGLVKVFFAPEEGLEPGEIVTVHFIDSDRKVEKKVYDFYRGLKFLQFGKKESRTLCPEGWNRRVSAEVCKCECLQHTQKIVFIKCV